LRTPTALFLSSLLLHPATVGSEEIPVDVFPGVSLSEPLEDRYRTGDAVPFAGRVEDAAMADGQILFNFEPDDGGDAVAVFIDLDGTDFRGYQVFGHDQPGSYALQVFLGGADATSLSFVGQYDGVQIAQGSGLIRLPGDFFRGLELAESMPTTLATGTAVSVAGQVAAAFSDGHLLFRFTPAGGGEAVRLDLPLRGDMFSVPLLFFHDQHGAYELEVFVGRAGASSLDFAGRFPVVVEPGDGTVQIPRRYFAGLILDQPLPGTVPVEVPVAFSGIVEDHVRTFRIELESAAGLRLVRVGIDAGRFDLPLRLLPGEAGPVMLSVVVEQTDGQFSGGRTFPFLGVPAADLPRLELGALALTMLPDGEASVPVANVGGAALHFLDWQVDGPFALIGVPEALEPGGRGQVSLSYAGAGGDHGTLTLVSDDPFAPRQTVGLRGLGSGVVTTLRHVVVGAAGNRTLDLDLKRRDQLLVLYSAPRYPETGAMYSYAVGAGVVAVAGKAAPGIVGEATERDRNELQLRRRERELAARWRAFSNGRNGKAAAATSPGTATAVEVGDSRTLVFPGLGDASAQQVTATVVAVNDRSVAWLQDGLRAAEENVDEVDIGAIIDRFSESDFGLTVDAFGAPSDVDGDGKVAVLFTHLVDDVGGVGGFYSASSVLPAAAGGDGNLSDMMYISPTQRPQIYRSLLVHEFQHLINFNQHVLVRGGESEVSWLNEGLSHVAEDLVSGHALSGVADLVRSFVVAPSAAGLHGEAQLNPHKRGAAYLFVRSLADRLGGEVLMRLVGTGLAGWDNIEAATGEEMAGLLATWASQAFASGLHLFEHPRFDYRFGQLQSGAGRGFPVPEARRHRAGRAAVGGSLPPRGVDYVHISGAGMGSVEIAADPDGDIGIVVIPLPRDRTLAVWMPPDFLPGLRFEELLPGMPMVGTDYVVSGQVESGKIGALLFQFAGEDTLIFEPLVEEGAFTQLFRFTALGSYNLEAFARPPAADDWRFVGAFGPVRVVAASAPTAVEGEPAATVPEQFALGAAYPNPFNGRAAIPVYAPGAGGAVELQVYNVAGQRVRTLRGGWLPAGWSRLWWDGTDEGGKRVASGVYTYQLVAGEYRAARSLLMLK